MHMRRGRNELLTKILLWVEEQSLISAEFFNKTNRPGGMHIGKDEWKEFWKNNLKERQKIWDKLEVVRQKQIFYSTMFKLRKEGLIKKEGDHEGGIWQLTKDGVAKLFKLKNKNLPNNRIYKKKKSNYLIIVSFDIPEQERAKRDWLRDALKNLEYKMLSESVWAGTNELPEEFIEHLGKINIMRYLKIFSVHKKGNIEINKI